MDLGHYNLGDYHFFLRIREGVNSLGELPDEQYLTHESFMSLATSVHEAYHVFQNLVTGAGCAVVEAEDHFIAAFREAARSGNEDHWILARLLSTGATYLRRKYYNAKGSEYLFRQAHRHAPTMTDELSALSQLTTANLLECQAALLTELYLCGLMALRPEAFNLKVVADMQAAFRLEKMPLLYRMPLDRFRELVGRVITPAGFERASRSHSLYRLCPNVAELVLLGFFLDYALHVPPPLAQEIEANHDVHQEDFDPPVRFAKLLEAFLADVFQAAAGLRCPELPDLNLYSPYDSLSPRLAKWIDIGDMLARSEANGVAPASVPPPQALFPLKREEIVKAVKLDWAPITFPSFADVSRQWLALERELDRLPNLFRLTATRIAAMEIRTKEPGIFSVWRPLGFFSEVGLPSFHESRTGFHPGMAAEITMRIKRTEYDAEDPRWRRFELVVAEDEPDQEFLTLRCSPGSPYAFLDQVIWREVMFRSCQSALNSEPMTCVLATDRFSGSSCEGRTVHCGKIQVPGELPQRSVCIARSLYEKYARGAK